MRTRQSNTIVHSPDNNEYPPQPLSLQPTQKRRTFTLNDAQALHIKSTNCFNEASSLLAEAREVAHKSGLSVDSSILDASYQSPFYSPPSHLPPKEADTPSNESNTKATNDAAASTATATAIEQQQKQLISGLSRKNALQAFPPILSTTGGHSNTDHLIQITGDNRSDTVAEYKRKLKRRAKAMLPEQRGTDRWDQQRIKGSRRRRIVREKDLPSAPPEPPPSGYVLFIAQMTTKIRHDRPNAHHDQIKVVREISKIWKFGMSDDDREYYNEFAREAREEYEKQHFEFRATGAYKKSLVFERLGNNNVNVNVNGDGDDSNSTSTDNVHGHGNGNGNGPWVRIAVHEKNALEREISNYDTVKFPPRPEIADKPEWVTKIELQNKREAVRRRQREERLKTKRQEDIVRLKEANKAKKRRLKQVYY